MAVTEEELVRVARAGGEHGKQAFDALIRIHQARVVRLATYLCGSAAAGEDVAQEAFIRAYGAIGSAREDTNFSGWLSVIVSRLAYNYTRNRGVRKGYEKSSAEERTTIVPPPGEVEAKETILKTLDKLSYPHREILLLRYVEELDLQEIGQALDLGASAVKMRLTRAREAFIQASGSTHKA